MFVNLRKIYWRLVFVVLGLLIFILLFPFLHTTKKTFEYQGMKREYLLHMPVFMPTGDKVPLIVALHGYRDSPRLMGLNTLLSWWADYKGYIVVYPYGTNSAADKELSWNATFCCGGAYIQKVDDLGFLENLVRDLKDKLPVDKEKIYVVGFSNGAMMAQKVGADLDIVSKVVIVSGAIGGHIEEDETKDLLTRARSMNILLIHGQRDIFVPFAGGEAWSKNVTFRSFEDEASFWRKINGCTGEYIETRHFSFTKQIFPRCTSGKVVTIIIFPEGEHVWMGGLLDWKGIVSGDFGLTTRLVLDYLL